MSERIQRQRTMGWRMPEGAVYVGRPSKWGNPYPAVEGGRTRASAVRMYRIALDVALERHPRFFDPLRGRDLACWCPLDQPCHADALLARLAEGTDR